MRHVLPLLALLLAERAEAQEPAPFLLRVAVAPEGPVWFGQRVTVTLTAMTPVRFVETPRWPDLTPSQGRAIVLSEATTVPGTERVNGESYAALQRTYTLFPAADGPLVLAPLRMTVRVAGADGQPVEASAKTAESRIEARLPDGVTDPARLVVAPSFRLNTGTEGDLSQVRIGDAVIRTLRMEADDTTAMLLPPALWGSPEGVRVYPDPPVIRDRSDRGVLHAERIERAAFVPQRAGAIELPGFGLTWLDPRSGRVQPMEVPPLRIQVLPAVATDEAQAAASPFGWRLTALAGLVVAAGLLWWTAMRRRHPEPAPLAALARACRAGDARAALNALYRWCDARALPGQEPTIAALAARAGGEALVREAAALERHLFGDGARWNGAALLHAARRAERMLQADVARRTTDPLPPLNPGRFASPPPRLAQPRWIR